MKKTIGLLAAIVMGVMAALMSTTGSAQAAVAVDYGTPYVTHGQLGESHIRGGDWAITSKVAGTASSFTTNGGVPASVATGATMVTRWRIVFTPDAGVVLPTDADGVVLPNFGTRLGGGFTQGAAFASNNKVVVLIYALGDKTA